MTAVEYGSFSKAAEILNYSQSGISRMIADLEREWKVTLLERNKGGVRLTSDGTKLFPYAKNLITEYEKLQMQVDCGFLRLPTHPDLETIFLKQDRLKAIIPAYRNIGLALKSKKSASLAVKIYIRQRKK